MSFHWWFPLSILDSFYIATFFFLLLQQLSTSVQFIIQWTLTKETIPLFSVFQTMYLCWTSSLLPVTLCCFACASTDYRSLQNILSQMLMFPDSIHCLSSLDLLKLLQFMHFYFFFCRPLSVFPKVLSKYLLFPSYFSCWWASLPIGTSHLPSHLFVLSNFYNFTHPGSSECKPYGIICHNLSQHILQQKKAWRFYFLWHSHLKLLIIPLFMRLCISSNSFTTIV